MTLDPIVELTPIMDPTDPYVRRDQTFPRLSAEQVERASEFGAVEALPKGTPLFARGERARDFFVVIEGTIEILDDTPASPSVVTTHEAHEFTGDRSDRHAHLRRPAAPVPLPRSQRLSRPGRRSRGQR